MLDLTDYPKRLPLRDGYEVTVRITEPSDEAELKRFLLELPPDERVYFRDDVTDPKVIHEWTQNIDLDRVIPLLALDGNQIIANWTLHHREHGWTRHHGHIRGIVHPKLRGRGLATRMVRELLVFAGQLDIERVVIELVEPQRELLQRYQKIGFKIDAVLKDWVKDFSDRYNDIHVLSMKLEPAWKKMEEMILNYGTHGG